MSFNMQMLRHILIYMDTDQYGVNAVPVNADL